MCDAIGVAEAMLGLPGFRVLGVEEGPAEVVDLAKKGGVSNKWSQHANENLAREFPDEFKALRQEIIQGTDTP